MTMRPHMPIMEELLYHISVEKTRDCTVQQFISKIDLDYSYGQMKISEETSRQCVTGGKFSGYYRFNKGFYGLAVIPTKFQGKSDWTLEYCTPALLDDIIVLTREDQQDHEKKLFEVLNKLEKARYRPRYQKIQILHEQKLLGHEIDENGVKEELEAIKKVKQPFKRVEVIPRCNTIHGKNATKTIGTDRPYEKVT